MKKLLLYAILAVVATLLIMAGCVGAESTESPSTAPAPAPEATPGTVTVIKPVPEPETTAAKPSSPSPESGTAIPESKGPLLSDALVRNCERTRTSGGFGSIGLAEGEIAVDFTLKDIHGNTVSLSGLLSEKPVVMVFGSFT